MPGNYYRFKHSQKGSTTTGAKTVTPTVRKAVKKEVKKAVARDQEFKMLDTQIQQNATTAGVLTPLDNPSVGTADNQRIGDEIVVRSIRAAFKITMQGSSTNDVVRIIIFADKHGYNVPLVTDLIGPIGTTQSVISPYSRFYKERFHVLYDKLFVLNNAKTQNYAFVKKFKRRMRSRFAGVSSFTNQLYVLHISDESTSGNEPLIDGWFRVTYTDA